MSFRTRFSKRVSVGISFDPATRRTKDSFKAECDVNNIVRRYHRTGQLPDLVRREPRYGDFSDVPSFLEALQRVSVAETAFSALPAAVRAECNNDPAVFLERVRDPEWALAHKLALPSSVVPSEAPIEKPPGAPAKPDKSGKDA